jgi:hypothetical protein
VNVEFLATVAVIAPDPPTPGPPVTGVVRVRMKALVSTAVSEAAGLDRLAASVTDKAIAGAGLIPNPATAIRAWAVWDLVGQRWTHERIC